MRFIQHASEKIDAHAIKLAYPNIFCKILFPASLHDRMIITRCIKNVRFVLCPESEIRIPSTP